MLATVLTTSALGLVLGAPGSAGTPDTVLDALAEDGRFTTLLEAVGTAGLGELLTGSERHTVFAPTDDAFAALPQAGLEALLADEEALEVVLEYHLVPGVLMADEVASGAGALTVLGQRLEFRDRTVDDALLLDTDNLARNGVFHAIDEVLVPDFTQLGNGPGLFDTLLALSRNEAPLGTFVTALDATRLPGTLAEGTFTVFAPNDRAFASLPDGVLERLLRDPERLSQVLSFHVVPGALPLEEITRLREAQTLLGERLSFTEAGGRTFVDGALIVAADVETSNGLIHVIDGVLVPELD